MKEVWKYERVMNTFLSSAEATYGLEPAIFAALDILHVHEQNIQERIIHPVLQAKPLKGSLKVNPIYIRVQSHPTPDQA